MNWLKKIKSFTVLMFVCSMLLSASLTSCDKAGNSSDDDKEEVAGDTTKKADHPQGEHPKNDSDTTKVEN